MDHIKKAIEGEKTGNIMVRKSVAKFREWDYQARVDIKMHEFPLEIINPINKKKYTINSWGNNHVTIDERDAMYAFLRKDMPMSDIVTQLPLNTRSRYIVKERNFKFIGSKKAPRLIIEAMVFNHWKEYGKNGYDTNPVGLPELNGLLVKLIDRAEQGKYFHAILLYKSLGSS